MTGKLLTPTSAKHARTAVLCFSIGSLFLVFQPFSMTLFSIGCVTIILSGLVFNVMPFLQAGTEISKIWRVLGTIFLILVIVFAIATLSAWAYTLTL